MANTQAKYQQSFHKTFVESPVHEDFGSAQWRHLLGIMLLKNQA